MIVVGLFMGIIVIIGIAAGVLLLIGSFFIFPPAPFLIVGWFCYSVRKYRWIERFWQAADRAKSRPDAAVVRRGSRTTKRRPSTPKTRRSIFAAPVVYEPDDEREEDSFVEDDEYLKRNGYREDSP